AEAIVPLTVGGERVAEEAGVLHAHPSAQRKRQAIGGGIEQVGATVAISRPHLPAEHGDCLARPEQVYANRIPADPVNPAHRLAPVDGPVAAQRPESYGETAAGGRGVPLDPAFHRDAS